MDFKKGIVASAVAIATALFPVSGASYSPGKVDGEYCGNVIEKGTHPLLARKSVELYEQKNGPTFTTEQKLLIEKGAIEEDSPEFCYMRSFNHFTEVGTGNGLWGFNSSQQWSQSPEDQLGDIPFHLMPLVVQQWYKGLAWLNDIDGTYPYGNHTWQRAISEKNLESLGHILHLLQDVTLPAHVRNDAHPGIIKLGKLEEANIHSILRGDSYESWSEDNSKLALLSSSNIPVYKTLDEIFDDVVKMTGNNFFSDDTIGNYPLPAVSKLVTKKEGKRTYYYNTIEGVEVPIARKSLLSAFMDKTIVTHKPHYVFDNKVLEAQWKIQGTRAIEIGAAAIALYVASIADKCVTHASKGCDSGNKNVYWQDSCGKLEEIAESCNSNQSCEKGSCVVDATKCIPFSVKKCVDNDIYWVDSCGNFEGLMKSCGINQICTNGLCVNKNESNGQFIDVGNGTVKDTKTGYVWQKQTISGKNYSEAIKYCQALVLGGSDNWNLPGYSTLITLRTEVGSYCKLNSIFKGACDNYWVGDSCAIDEAEKINFITDSEYSISSCNSVYNFANVLCVNK